GVIAAIERVVSVHLGRRWAAQGFTNLDDRASHPCGILRGHGFSVFAKVGPEDQFAVELRSLAYLRDRAGVATAVPVGPGVLVADGTALLLLEAAPEGPPDWWSFGRTLAALHRVRGERFGLEFDGFFGPLPQDNRPVPTNRWADFYAQRRLLPLLRMA